jgi:sulfide:quinone oxidoreductase
VSEMATPILAEKGIELHTFFNVETIDPERKVVASLEGEELPYDLLILVPPHRGQQFVIDSGLAPAPGGWIPTDRHTLEVKDQTNVYALGDATDLPLSKAGSTAHFEAPVVAERIAAIVKGRKPEAKHAEYQGKVMCFFEVGDGKGTLLQFDYDHPPRPPKPNQLWHLGKIVFNKTYWHTVPRGRV